MFLLTITSSYSADEKNICYFEKKLCKHCQHYHEKHIHLDSLSSLNLRGKLDFDYKADSIADSSVKNEHVQPFKDILKQIKKQINVIERHTSHFTIRLDISENYLTDQSINELASFLERNNILKGHLRKLNISNNKLTEASFDALEKILKLCPKIKIDLSFNSISSRNFRDKFQDDMDKLSFKAY